MSRLNYVERAGSIHVALTQTSYVMKPREDVGTDGDYNYSIKLT